MQGIHDSLKYAAAVAATPFMRRTGFRLSKAWRGNKWIDHVAANFLANGIKPGKYIY